MNTVRDVFTSEVNTLKELMQGLNMEQNSISNVITPFLSFASNIDSFKSKEQMIKLIEIKNEQSKLLSMLMNKLEEDKMTMYYSEYLESGDDYYSNIESVRK